MSESLQKTTNSALDALVVGVLHTTAKKMERLYGKGIANVMRGALDRLNVEPEYLLAKDSEKFAESRARLSKEPGVLISNHPNGLDALPVLALIDREDVLIFTSGPETSDLENMFSKGKFISPGESVSGMRTALKRIQEHIQQGGLFVIFPTGGLDALDFEFKSGFRSILTTMKPTDMVYACRVNPDDAIRMEETLPRGFGFIQALFDDATVRKRKKEEPLRVRVREHYTNAKEWQDALGTWRGRRGNIALSHHYEELFSGTDFD